MIDHPIPLLEMKNITKHYANGENIVRALDDVSLKIYQGEFIAIMGQSGSGKSTMMNIIGCLDNPTSGNYLVRGVEASKMEPDELATLRRETFGFVFQRYNLLPNITAIENVEIPAIYAGTEKSKRVSYAQKLLTDLGIGERGGHKPTELSGGQQQRVAIARALMNDPLVILADEPTGALDSRSGEEVMALLKRLHKEGRTIILITHDSKVAEHAERVIQISDGKISADPEPKIESAKLQTHTHAGAKLLEVGETIKMSLRALQVNIFRTLLTLLGIIIGVAAVITLLAVGNGSKESVISQISSMGTNLVSIRPGAEGIRSSGDIATLVPDDATALMEVPNVNAVLPERNGRYTLRYGNSDYATTVTGTGDMMPLAKNWAVAKGSFFTQYDIKSYAAVAVVGKTVADIFFPQEDPVGKFILVKNIPFEIIGVMASKGAGWGGDQDDVVFVPYTTGLMRLFGKTYLSSMTVSVDDVDNIDATQTEITRVLKDRHRAEDFSVRNMSSLIDMVTESQNTLTIMLGAVAAISLLVGGIGVMNIMLVSVTERTREIGVRMATGARKKDIMLQFNIEALVVCSIGGIIGIIFGLATSLTLKAFGVNIMLTLMPAVLAFSSAFLTGVIFGYLPARKAANLDPVIALSSE